MANNILRLCAAACLALVCASQAALAQNVQNTRNTADESLKSDLRVDPSTLGLTIDIPFGSYAGRGMNVPVGMRYSSKGLWNMEYAGSYHEGPCCAPSFTANPQGQPSDNNYSYVSVSYDSSQSAGWESAFRPPSILDGLPHGVYDSAGDPCDACELNERNYVQRLRVVMPDGSTHELRRADTVYLHSNLPNGLGTYYSVDGSRLRYVETAAATGTLYLPDGSRFTLGNQPHQYIDRDGNRLLYNDASDTWTDTLGRAVGLVQTSNQPLEQVYSLTGFGGAPRYITFRYRYLADLRGQAAPTTGDMNVFGQGTYPGLFQSAGLTRVTPPATFNPAVLTEIELPDGRKYQFGYNEFGEVDKVVYPTGGYERYLHAVIPGLDPVNEPYAQTNRGVVDRWVSPSGSGLDESHTHYEVTAGAEYVVKITGPDGSYTERRLHRGRGPEVIDFGFDDSRAGMAYDERAYTAAGQMLRRTLTKWEQSGPQAGGSPTATRDPRVTRVTELVLDAGGVTALAKTTEYEHDADLNVTQATERGFVSVSQATAQSGAITSIPSGAVVRKTRTTYLVNDLSVDANTRAAYRARDLVSLATSALVLDASDAVVARTEYRYDEPGYYLASYGTVTGWADPATLVRGNVTTVRSYVAAASAVAPTSACPAGVCVDTHTEYDLLGNTTGGWDGKGVKTTTVSYSSAHAYAYPTSVTTAAPNSAAVPNPSGNPAQFGAGTFGSTTGFTSHTAYDHDTGLVTSTTDANGKTTLYDYTDLLNRLKRVDLPDGGSTEYFYGRSLNAGVVNDYVRTLSSLDSSRSVESYQFFDGLGRPTRSFLNEGGSPVVFLTTDTQYDTMGRVWKVSSPYRTNGSGAAVNPAGRWTTTEYDALGRVVKVTTPDGARVRTEYGGAHVRVTDQADKQRVSIADALGRLAEVWEVKAADAQAPDSWLETFTFPVPAAAGVPSVSTGYKTTYAYDALGNLKTVTQGAQTRAFVYDSLSRLTSAANPESGAVAYAYDANGNLITKTDARGVTATHVYDRLNRNVITHYAGGGAATPDLRRFYDAAANGRGRPRRSEAVGVSASEVISYDSMGRPTERRQSYWVNNWWGQEYSVRRSYNKGGGVASQTYPSGHAVTYNYDAAGRPGDNGSQAAFAGDLGDGVRRTYASLVTYDETGGIRQERFGTQAPLYHKLHYNARGQLYDVRLSTVAWAADEWNWNRGAVALYFGGYAHQQSGPANNGNVSKAQHWVPLNEQMTSYAYTEQSFTYDPLNRLTSVTELHGGHWGQSGPDFKQDYKYDRWGNRTIDAAETQVYGQNPGYTIPEPQFELNPSSNQEVPEPSNRLYAPGDSGRLPSQKLMRYDAAGNLTHDSHTGMGGRTYDGENRMTAAVMDAQGNWAFYSYDADGRRVKRKVANEETWQVYGIDGELLAEYRAGAAPFLATKEYGYRGGELLVTMSSGDVDRLKRFVKSLYYNCYARDPLASELTARIDQLGQAGAQGGEPQLLSTAKTIARGLFESAEYAARGRTDSQYVTDLYNAYLQRAPDGGGLNHWVQHTQTYGRGATLNAFEVSTEFSTLAATLYGRAGGGDNQRVEQFVRALYYGARRQEPSGPDMQSKTQRLNNAAALGQSQVVAEARAIGGEVFVETNYNGTRTTQEYVTDLYEAFLQRAPDGPGLNHWVNHTNAHGRASTLSAFQQSTEFGELAGTLHRETFWLVSDHLGTPRMVADRTGSLAGIKRHDYLPFGEELSANTGGRTTTQGYGASDDVRQQFTQKERDDETQLDYFLARYYSASQGRFTSPDEFKGSPHDLSVLGSGDREKQALVYAEITNPPSLNKYQYAFNNPLRFVDPDGHDPQDRLELEMRHDEKKLMKGEMSREEFLARQRARGAGALAGLAIYAALKVGLAAGVTLLEGAGAWAARNPDKLQQVANEAIQMAQGNPTPSPTSTIYTVTSGSIGRFKIIKELSEGEITTMSVQGAKAEIRVMTTLIKEGDTLIFRGTNIEAAGPGSSGMKELKDLAREFGRQLNVKKVIIEPAKRTSGRHKGQMTRPMEIPVD